MKQKLAAFGLFVILGLLLVNFQCHTTETRNCGLNGIVTDDVDTISVSFNKGETVNIKTKDGKKLIISLDEYCFLRIVTDDVDTVYVKKKVIEE